MAALPKHLTIINAWRSAGGDIASFNRELCAALARSGARVDCLVPRATAAELADAQSMGVSLLIADGGDLHRPPAWSDGIEPDVIVGYGRITGDAALTQAGHHANSRRRRRVHIALGDESDDVALAQSAEVPATIGSRSARSLAVLADNLVHSFVPGLSSSSSSSSSPTDTQPNTPEHARSWRCLAFGDLSTFEVSGLDIVAQSLAILVRGQQKAAEANEPSATKIELVVRTSQPGFADVVRDRILTIADLPKGDPSIDAIFKVEVADPGSEAYRSLDAELQSTALVVYPQTNNEFGLEVLEAIGAGIPVLVSSSSGLADVLLEKAPPLAALHIAGVQRNMSADATEWSSRMNDELTNHATSLARARRLRFALQSELTWDSTAKALLDRLAQGGDTSPPSSVAREKDAAQAPPDEAAAARTIAARAEASDRSCQAALAAFDAASMSKEPAAVGATLSLLVSWFEQFDAYDELYQRWNKISQVFRDGIDLSIFTRGGEGTEALAIATAKTIFYRQRDLSGDERLELVNRVRALLKPTQYYAVAKIDLERSELLANADDPDALPTCNDAVSAAEQMQDPGFLGVAMISHAIVLGRMKRYKEAREVADKGIALFEQRGSGARHAIAVLNQLKAEIALRQEPRDIVGASVFTAEAIKGYQATMDSVGEAHVLISRAEVLFARNKRDEALVQYDRAVKLYDAAQMRTQQGRALMGRASYHVNTHNEREAIRDLEKAEKYLEDSPERSLQIQSLIAQGDAHGRLDDHAWIVDRIDHIESLTMALKPTIRTASIMVQVCGLAKKLPVPDKPRIKRIATRAIEIARSWKNVDVEAWAKTFLDFAG